MTRHDFSKPSQPAPDLAGKLKTWQAAALARGVKAWVKRLPFALEASAEGVQAHFAGKLLPALPDTFVAFRLDLGPGLSALLLFPRATLLQIAGGLLGDAAPEASERDLTLVEEKLAEYFLIHEWLPHFRESWPGAPLGSWQLGPREPAPAASRLFREDEVILALSWKIKGTQGESEGCWLIPKKPLLEALDTSAAAADSRQGEMQAAQRRGALVQRLPLRLDVVLGTTQISFAQLSRMQVGDVLLLDQAPESGVLVQVAGKNLFHARAGRHGAWKAVCIDSILEKDP